MDLGLQGPYAMKWGPEGPLSMEQGVAVTIGDLGKGGHVTGAASLFLVSTLDAFVLCSACWS